MFDDPEAGGGVMDDGDGLFGSVCDGVIAALKVDGHVVVDAALVAKGKVEVEQGERRSRAHTMGAGGVLMLPNADGDQAGGALAGAVLALEFHLEDGVCLRKGGDICVFEQGDDAALEGAKAAFDFPFCLRRGSDEMGDAEGAQGALEFALRVAAVGAGAGAKETEPVGVEGLWDAVQFKGGAKMREVVPGGIGGDEAGGEVEAGMIIHGEEKDLFLRSRPPLVDGSVVLPEFADAGTAETPVAARGLWQNGEQAGEVIFSKSLDAGACALEAKEPFEFIRSELEIRRSGERKKGAEKSDDVLRPSRAMSATAGSGQEGIATSEPGGAELIEPGFADAELSGSTRGVQVAIVKSSEDAEDEIGG